MICNYHHNNVDILYGTEPCGIEDLPKFCICGSPITYADEICFVNYSIESNDIIETKVKWSLSDE